MVKKAALAPGMDTMMQYKERASTQTRPPTRSEIAEAYKTFVSRKMTRNEDHHIQALLESFQYLQEHPNGEEPWLTMEDLKNTVQQLVMVPNSPPDSHLALARLVQDEIFRRHEVEAPGKELSYKDANIYWHIKCLCAYGATSDARELLQKYWPEEKMDRVRACQALIMGFAREDNSSELLKTLGMLGNWGVPFQRRMQKSVVRYFVDKGEMAEAKHWYQQPVVVSYPDRDEPATPYPITHSRILMGCVSAGDLQFGEQVIASLCTDMSNKLDWDAIFLWSLAIGKGVDEVERMMKVMVRQSEELERTKNWKPMRPDIDTINMLVEYSMGRNDHYTAERFITLGEKWGIMPNARTFLMQMEYRIGVNDIDGARTAFFGLQGESYGKTREPRVSEGETSESHDGLSASERKPIEEQAANVINKLVQAMCKASRYHFDDIMEIVDDMLENKLPFTPETVASLTLQHLKRGENYDAADLLQTYAHDFSSQQRAYIRDQLVNFCLDPKNSTADCWDTYTMVRNVFKETPREIRNRLMNEFFARKRPDMGCHIFFHMRTDDRPGVRANTQTYIDAFTGFAHCKDAESLELVHNQLKLDWDIELDTRLRSALMLAYSAIGQHDRAMEFWTEIVGSQEGPTYRSIAIAFRCCEGMAWGERFAKPIWERLRGMDIEVERGVFAAYVGAIAGCGRGDEALKLVEGAEAEHGFKPDLEM